MKYLSQGNVASKPLAEICWDLHSRRQTALLSLKQAAQLREFEFVEGMPCASRSSVPSESLERILLDRKLVTEAALERAVVHAAGGLSLHEALLASGAIQRSVLEPLLCKQAREVLPLAFRLRRADYTVAPLQAAPRATVEDVDFLAVLRDGVTRHMDFELVAVALQAFTGVTLKQTPQAPGLQTALRLTADERKVLQAIDGSKGIGDLGNNLGLDPYRLFPILFLARCTGLIEAGVPLLARPSPPPPAATVMVPPASRPQTAAPPPPPPAPEPPAPTQVLFGKPAVTEPPQATMNLGIAPPKATPEAPSPPRPARPYSGPPPSPDLMASAEHAPIVEALVHHGYQILKPLGRGGWGWVYQAYQERLDRLVAVKVLAPSLPKDQKFQERFFREARSAARLNHPNVVAVYDCNEQAGVHYLVMEFVEGATLRQLVEKGGALREAEAASAAAAVAAALEHAHARDVLHRDVKPENVFVSRDRIVKLGDWGLAKSVLSADANLTDTGYALGTPNYMSPEQLKGEKEIDHRTDIYSMGALIHFLVTGRPPYEGPSVVAIMTSHLFDPPPDPRRRNPAVSAQMAAIVGKAMAKDPAGRFQTAAELEQALAAVARV